MKVEKVAAEFDKLQGRKSSWSEKQIELYRAILMARRMDDIETSYLNRGAASFAVSGAGHEALAALNQYLSPSDYLHLHYRDKALMLARGVTPTRFFQGFFCKSGSFSEGRQMSAHPAERALNILSLTGPVGNHALQAVGIAAEIRERQDRPIVVCSFGDGTSQQGEVMEAIAEAVRSHLPVLFVIEDNRLAISTRTSGKTFYDLPDGPADSYYGLPIHRLDGSDVLTCSEAFDEIVKEMRKGRGPAIALLAVERIADHTNSDDQASYRDAAEIAYAREKADPLALYCRALLAQGMSEEFLHSIEQGVMQEVSKAAEFAFASAEPTVQIDPKRPFSGAQSLLLDTVDTINGSELTMLETMRAVLRERLSSDVRVTLYGQDIEDPKGDVFGVTRGLSSEFPGKVINSALSESTIVGTSIGRALAGGKPVAFLQFADFLPLAFNQVASELGSMYWRTAGQWECPVIVMIACGGYRDGLGPFHAQSMESLALQVPGIDVFMPSNGADARRLLNFAFDSGRPTLFFYPKNCLNRKALGNIVAASSSSISTYPLQARIVKPGHELTIVCYGNTVPICCDVSDIISRAGMSVEVIDLCSLSPWDEATVISSVEKTGRIIVVHEDNRTCGFGAEILATVLEKTSRKVLAKRVVRDDTYVPCNFGNQLQVLPSFERVLTEAALLLDLHLTWVTPAAADEDIHVVQAMATGPSDQSVCLLEWQVAVEDRVAAGQTLGSVEGMKCVFDFDSPVEGKVEKLLVEKGATIEVGAPLAHIRIASGQRHILPRQTPIPVLQPLKKTQNVLPEVALPLTQAPFEAKVGIVGVAAVLGSREVGNDELIRTDWRYNSADIVRMTGIRSRRRAAEGESVVSLGATAARQALEQANLSITDIELVICATGTPDLVSPSVACRILESLGGSEHGCPAYDVSAACAGYLYGLGLAHDHLHLRPGARVLLITSEIISPLIDEKDFGTSILFGDAATATILSGSDHEREFRLYLNRPYLSSRAEPGKHLRAPHADSNSSLFMDGMKVFEWGVRCMTSAVRKACFEANMDVSAIDLLVPHQANKRIIDTVCQQLQLPPERLYMNLATIGNTSSSSIPICVADLLAGELPGKIIGMAAFGAGFTYGACLLKGAAFAGEKND